MLSFLLLSIRMKNEAVLEDELIKRIAQKDERALENLYDRYSKLLYNVILLIIKDHEDALDILQELFLHIWKKAESYDSLKGNCGSWLVRTAKNLTIDRLRSKSHKGKSKELLNFDFEFFYDEMGRNQLDLLVSDEMNQKIQNALKKIPIDEKEVITLAYYEGYTQSEIADKLKIPIGTVKTRTRKGMQRLQQLILK